MKHTKKYWLLPLVAIFIAIVLLGSMMFFMKVDDKEVKNKTYIPESDKTNPPELAPLDESTLNDGSVDENETDNSSNSPVVPNSDSNTNDNTQFSTIPDSSTSGQNNNSSAPPVAEENIPSNDDENTPIFSWARIDYWAKDYPKTVDGVLYNSASEHCHADALAKIGTQNECFTILSKTGKYLGEMFVSH